MPSQQAELNLTTVPDAAGCVEALAGLFRTCEPGGCWDMGRAAVSPAAAYVGTVPLFRKAGKIVRPTPSGLPRNWVSRATMRRILERREGAPHAWWRRADLWISHEPKA